MIRSTVCRVSFVENLIPYIVTGFSSLIVGALLIYLQPSAKVVYWSPHSFFWKVVPKEDYNENNEPVPFQTDMWTIQNIGRRSTADLDMLFEERPDHWQLQPPIVHDTIKLDNEQFAIRIPELGPKEIVTVAVFSYKTEPRPLSIKSSVGPAKRIDIGFERSYGPWLYWFRAFLIMLGLATALYWSIIGVHRLYSCMSGCVL